MELKLDLVSIGRIMGGVVILLAVVSAIVGASSARTGGFDLFLWRLTTPMGIGFLIIVLTEILQAVSSGSQEGGEDPPADVSE